MIRHHAGAMRVVLGLAGVALATSACAGGAARGLAAIPDPAARQLAPASVTLDARLLQMADLRQPDTALLDSVLALPAATAESRRRRGRVALLIGQLQLRPRYDRLRAMLNDPDTVVAANAAFALGLARDTASLGALGAALEAGRSTVASEAAWALGRIGEPARAFITNALTRSVSRPPVVNDSMAQTVSALLVAASGLRPVPVRAVTPLLDDPVAGVAVAAAYALSRPRAVGGARALLSHVAHPDVEMRRQVALMAAHNVTGDSLAAQAGDVLDALVTDTAPAVRLQAIRSRASQLERRPDLEQALALVREGLGDPAAAVRVTAAEQAGALLPADPDVWGALWLQDTTFMVQRALLTAAAPRRMLATPLREWEQHPDPWRRVATLELQTRYPPLRLDADGSAARRDGPSLAAPPEWQRAAWARADTTEQLRVAGVALLAGVGQPAARDTLRRYLTDPAPRVRAAALTGLARQATAQDAEIALDMYQRDSSADADPVRQGALRVVASAWRRDSLAFSAALRASLGSLPVPADPRRRASVERVTPLRSWQSVARTAPSLDEYVSLITRWHVTLPPTVGPRAILHTERGDIELVLHAPDAPLTVQNFVSLARRGWFRNTRFHRVIPNFVAQDGDPTGTGSGGPGTTIRDELNRFRYRRGAVGMALSGPDTGGSQYFLTLAPQPHLDGGYTVFAQVTQGLDVMDALLLGDRILDVSVPSLPAP